MSRRVGWEAVDFAGPVAHLRSPTINDRRRPSAGGGVKRARRLSNRVVFALMSLTSVLAVFDLYLLVSSAFH